MNIVREVKKVIAFDLSIKESSIKISSNLIHDSGADDMDTIQIIMSIESKFGIAIPDDAAVKIETVKDIIEIVKSQLNKQET